MKVSASGRDKIMRRESCKLAAYRDERGVLTIGVGHTGRTSPPPVWPWSRITQAQADAYLETDLAPTEAAVNDAVKLLMTQNQFDAMVSLAFNIGVMGFTGSTVVHDFNNGQVRAAADAFLMWEKPPDLKARREAEREQFLTPDVTVVA